MTKRVLILVEGQTEERFVKDVLGPAFIDKDLYLIPTLLVTKRVKDGANFKGGVTSFGKFQNDVTKLLYGASDALITTLIDYYALPADFPGMNSRPAGGTPLQRVAHVEQAIHNTFGAPQHFLPFLALHEFEALLFSSPIVVPTLMTQPHLQASFAQIRSSVLSPEYINERPGFAPSKQIVGLFPAFQKVLHGPTAALRIGLDLIRQECRHFSDWIQKLEQFAAS